jgi:chromosome segregation ATPase
VRSDYYSLQSSYSSLQSRSSNLQSEVYSLQSRNSSLQSEVSSLRSQNSARDSQISTLNSQLTNTQNQLRNKEGELATNKKELGELRNSFNNLTMISNNQGHDLEKKERKIRELKELLGKSKEEIIDYKLKAKESRLETLIQKLEVDRAKIRDLRKTYQKFIFSGNNQDEIDDYDDKIESIKDELIDGGIDIVNAQKLCSKCEKLAKLKLEQDNLYKERFEARQEVVVYQ